MDTQAQFLVTVHPCPAAINPHSIQQREAVVKLEQVLGGTWRRGATAAGRWPARPCVYTNSTSDAGGQRAKDDLGEAERAGSHRALPGFFTRLGEEGGEHIQTLMVRIRSALSL